MALTGMLTRLDEGQADETVAGAYRFLVNANKYVTSIGATDTARRGIEVLGGNGTIEDFSPLPRLYRDAMVFESWEGTHNVLCAQVLRDCERLGILDHLLTWLRTEGADAGKAGADSQVLTSALEALEPRLRRSIADAGYGAAHFRRQLDLLVPRRAGDMPAHRGRHRRRRLRQGRHRLAVRAASPGLRPPAR